MEEKENDETTSSNNGEMEKKREEEGEEEAWGTLEELLLVCAVNRHGFNSWDSIAKELQKRIKHSSNNDDKIDVVNDGDDGGDGDGGRGGGTVDSSFSSGNCRKKYVHLKRRFHHEEEAPAAEEEAAVMAAEGGEEHLMRMVDELRKLRVEELKREVHRHDVSIVSLQLKVKKLEEERENSKVKAEDEEENEEEKTVLLSDLRIKPEENATATGGKGDEPERSSLEKVVTGDSAENRSCNESNSTNHPKTDNTKPGNESKRGEPGAVRVERKRSEPVDGDNHNHNNRKVSRLSELVESLSESRRESTRQQSSDVQSSASLSKKKRRRFRGDSGDELEAEEVSPANKRINAKSQPLIRFLETLRSHKHGSVFQRRLPSQETEKYRNVIRQHMDLDTVQSRLDKGIYCDCHPKFYRDLLLTFTNAVLFYRKSTAEHIAARELRRFVMDEIQKTRKPKVQPRKPNLEPQHLEPVVKKPRSSTTMVVCRRRISNSMQPLSDGMKKADTNHTTSTTNIYSKNNNSSNVVNGREEKVKPDQNQKKVSGSNNISSGSRSSKKEKEKEGDENLKKLLTKERSNLGNGGLRLSNSNGKKIISKEGGIKREKTGNVSKDSKQESSEGERVEVMERKKVSNSDQKQEKGTPPTPVLKKQGVAKFLKRMKQNSPSSQEKVKSNDSEEDEEEEEEGVREKNPSNNKNNARKTGGNLKKSIVKDADVVGTTRRSSSRRGEEAAASRRGIGRPPKRKAAMMSGSTPDSGKGGRSGGRDGSEKFKKKPRR